MNYKVFGPNPTHLIRREHSAPRSPPGTSTLAGALEHRPNGSCVATCGRSPMPTPCRAQRLILILKFAIADDKAFAGLIVDPKKSSFARHSITVPVINGTNCAEFVFINRVCCNFLIGLLCRHCE